MASNSRLVAALLLLCASTASGFSFGGKGFLAPAKTLFRSDRALQTTAWTTRPAKADVQMSAAVETDTLADYVTAKGGNLPIRKVLIANNGMAATKSIMSMRQWAYMELGDEKAVEFVAMATPEDMKANAEFIKLADSYVEVPAGKNSNNYANVDVIVSIAKKMGVDAVWPGWGHASENPDLPRTLAANGIKFIGPTAPVMSVLGDKIAANILAQTAKVPSIPWSGDGLVADLTEEGTIPDEIFNKAMVTTAEEAIAAAERIGYPVMLKASEGGGGKGIRMSANSEELATNFVQVSNEVPGSPMFMMQLCTQARHLEVQIVGDEHGNAIALNGRDCSTQRRFQKIFEEGPPTIAKADTFKEMQRAAQRLTQSIGYIGAGTVEYLYNAETDSFFFLELNPRLQVEHPVTEGLTLVNLPATQLQVAMGIPLYRIPEIRRFYGLDPEGDSKIDFMTEDYEEIENHVIAARITAENPDEGFKPTSGSIERVNFQSTSNVWGYFSVGANGGIHEFADSQFGHLFAKGATREAARKSLVLALKEIEVRGDIRTTVDYLVQLLETDAFKQNTIDTSWLDGIIREKSVSTELEPHTTVAAAAIYRAHAHVQSTLAGITESLGKGQLSMGALADANEFPVEISYKDIKYSFVVKRTGAETFELTINGASFEAKVREQPDGSLLANFEGDKYYNLVGFEEPLGLRVVIDGTTCLLPNIIDPSELRTDVTGKVVRYLQEDGGQVEVGEPYVEVEAMKMIMPLKATEAGAIKHELSAGSIISTGDLLASLQLKDPSKVKKIENFDGVFAPTESAPPARSAMETLGLAFEGYEVDGEKAVAALLDDAETAEDAVVMVADLLDRFATAEAGFAGKSLDAVNLELVKANKDSLDTVIALNLAHRALSARRTLVLALLRQFESLADRFGSRPMTDAMQATLDKLKALGGREYGAVALAATNVIAGEAVEPFAKRLDDLRSMLMSSSDLTELAHSPSLCAGVDLLSALFNDEDSGVRAKALETYIRRVYRSHVITKLDVVETDGVVTCNWDFKYATNPGAEPSPLRKGQMSVLKEIGDTEAFAKMVDNFAALVPEGESSMQNMPLNVMHVAFENAPVIPLGSAEEAEAIAAGEAMITAQKDKLESMGVRLVNLLTPQPMNNPRYFSYTSCNGFGEDPDRRDMRPTFYHLLELERLTESFSAERMSCLTRNTQVYLGVEKNSAGRGPPPQSVFLRAVSHEDDVSSEAGAERLFLAALDELDRAALDSRVTMTTSSRIFLNLLSEQPGSAKCVLDTFRSLLSKFQSQFANRLLSLKVDEIEVKVRVAEEDGTLTPVRLIASSMSGKWLQADAYLEYPDPVTGVTKMFCGINDDAEDAATKCYLSPYPTSNKLQMKRASVRRISSTYAYDFLGLMEVDLVQRWGAFVQARPGMEVPVDLFSSKELIIDESGELRNDIERVVGTNDIGMVAWHCTMKTPEYPEGREVVVIANDVTVQSGSFGVKEDDFFQAATNYARDAGLPRVYIACNSGARIGLVENLKPLFQVAWKDESNPGQGFDYLYLKDEDFKALPEGTVNSREVKVNGEVRHALDDIVGQVHGIGVENLRGSGTIAGETARAYDDIFTLSYVTGRSVGIGAYLVRLGQRCIQMEVGPMILTGYSALNKLLGREVYTSQDQLGGPEVMFPNGVSHEVVQDDQQGVAAIMDWLSFVPKDVHSTVVEVPSIDPVDRPVDFMPTKAPYDPRHMLAGVNGPNGEWTSGFFDRDSFKEYLAGWGKSVVVGRARLGGIPMGVISVETRLVDQRIPADPANPDSREAIQPQAGQVWYPDSAYKTAQAINDFGRGENLPLIIFANWRGFSGGTRDMAGEILKFGSMIVDALVKYQFPVFVYIPPNGELRGGAWVVIDPTINSECMEMYADTESRGGILEPPGICEVKFRPADQISKMHQLDPVLLSLDQDLEQAASEDDVVSLKKQIKDRETTLMPLYLQVAHEFADLHDRSGRMKAKGVVRDVLEWPSSREYLYWRVKRRLVEDELRNAVKLANPGKTHDQATFDVQAMAGDAYGDDKAFISYVADNEAAIQDQLTALKTEGVKTTIAALLETLSADAKAAVLEGLK